MAALSSMYEKPSISNKVHLMRRLFNLRMTERASMTQHLNKLNTITTQLSSVEIEFDDEVRALILLSSLPDSWNATITAGHFKRDCRALKKNTGAQESANVTEETGDAMILSVNSPIESWILDSGASFHSTPCREIMENYVSGGFRKVHLADDETLKIVGKGDIRLKLPNQTTWRLKGVRHIPGLKRNLISVGQLDVADVDGKSNLWHQRLGHMSEKGMKTLLSKGKLPDLKNVDVGLCEDCIFGKQKKVSFAKIGKTPKAERLELVHTDVSGSSPVPSLAGSLYYVTFIDDSTRKAEAINTAAYLINRGPSVPLDGRIPEEVWSKKEINLSHLRVFGCISYVHIDSAERNYENRKIVRSRDVIFNENVMYKDKSTAESSNTEAETKEFAEFEEISGNDVQITPEAVQEEPCTPELRRSSRIPKPTQRYSPSLHYLLLTGNGEPECYDEAMQVENSVKIKEEHDGSKRYKVRLVVKGFQQKEDIDYNEIFSPVVKLSTIRLVLKIVAVENLHLEQLDVKTAFLHGDLEEEIYMRQLEDFIKADKKNMVCRLKKSLYGLKQAPRQWYKKFDSFMGSNGFTRFQADHCCYIKRFDNSFIILLLYVDDMLVAGSDMQEIIHLKQELSKQFAMKDLGAAKQILGMRIKRNTKLGILMLSQAEYINKVLSRFNMQDANPVSTPLGVHFRLSKDQSPKTEEERAHIVKVPYASAIGSLMYVMVCTRPDIAQAVGAVSRYMNSTLGSSQMDPQISAGNVDIRRSTAGYVYTLEGTAVSWVSQLQKIVALSTTEAEYVAITEASKEMVLLQSFLEELGKKQENNVLRQSNSVTDSSILAVPANIVQGSGTSIVQLFRVHFNIQHGQNQKVAAPVLSLLQKERLKRLQKRLEVPFDGSQLEHQDALWQLWRLAYPNRELPSLKSELWGDMGWQGTDPSTDFRGGGFISLENLIFFAKNYPESFQSLLHKKDGNRADWEYPFAVAGINISFMLVQMLNLRSGKPSSLAGIRFLQLLGEDETAFDNLFCVAFQMMDAQWLIKRASYLDFNDVLKSTRKQLKRELELDGVASVKDLPAFNMLRSREGEMMKAVVYLELDVQATTVRLLPQPCLFIRSPVSAANTAVINSKLCDHPFWIGFVAMSSLNSEETLMAGEQLKKLCGCIADSKG
ncbi:Detected protein of confused Function [Hibiscus syriacus]|uniref:Detected protein of confused Function n=1 Tax=Hibiscus syriacus TaxID=106335 RepID=A0A6A3B3K8_HIBSY|nr:Detected protein of confused Function [Hibiscus syriacus]